MLFNTLFKNNTTQYAKTKKKKKKKRKGKVETFTTIFAVGYPSTSSPRPTGLDLSGATKKPSFARVIARYVFLAYVAMLYVNYPRCGDCAFSVSFVRGSVLMLVCSFVAGEGVELTVHKESVVVEEIKEVELRSRRGQFIYDRNYNRTGSQPCT